MAAWVSKSTQDAERTAAILDGSALDGILDVGDQYGHGLTIGAATRGLLVAGQATDSPRLRSLGSDLARSLLVSGAVVWALKLSVDARRPNGGRYSFPSGHTAAAFAAAPVWARHGGWHAGLPAYALAAATGLARMEERRHYVADVLFGAALGLVAGFGVVDGRGPLGFLQHVSLSPGGLVISLGS
jgi:membrane-associated phospholipid phosphatase